MSEADEVAKANLHRANAVKRLAFERTQRRLLSGNANAAAAVRKGFQPVIKAALEKRDSGAGR